MEKKLWLRMWFPNVRQVDEGVEAVQIAASACVPLSHIGRGVAKGVVMALALYTSHVQTIVASPICVHGDCGYQGS
jgi:hypothetical protein